MRGLLGASFQALRSLPFVDSVVDAWLAHEAKLALDRQLSSMGYSDDEEDVDAEGNKGQGAVCVLRLTMNRRCHRIGCP